VSFIWFSVSGLRRLAVGGGLRRDFAPRDVGRHIYGRDVKQEVDGFH